MKKFKLLQKRSFNFILVKVVYSKTKFIFLLFYILLLGRERGGRAACQPWFGPCFHWPMLLNLLCSYVFILIIYILIIISSSNTIRIFIDSYHLCAYFFYYYSHILIICFLMYLFLLLPHWKVLSWFWLILSLLIS